MFDVIRICFQIQFIIIVVYNPSSDFVSLSTLKMLIVRILIEIMDHLALDILQTTVTLFLVSQQSSVFVVLRKPSGF